jgi:hypothetical protein
VGSTAAEAVVVAEMEGKGVGGLAAGVGCDTVLVDGDEEGIGGELQNIEALGCDARVLHDVGRVVVGG